MYLPFTSNKVTHPITAEPSNMCWKYETDHNKLAESDLMVLDRVSKILELLNCVLNDSHLNLLPVSFH